MPKISTNPADVPDKAERSTKWPRKNWFRVTSITLLMSLIPSSALGLATPPLRLYAKEKRQPDNEAPIDPVAAVERAVAQWRRGNYKGVRLELAAFLSEQPPLVGRETLEVAHRYLADAILLDESLEPDERETLARKMIERQLDSNPDWVPPAGLHGDAFYSLVTQVRADREVRAAASCVAEHLACTAELKELQVNAAATIRQNAELHAQVNEQLVVVEEKIARNRALALVPFGVGHFYNGKNRLGVGFLAAEAALGAAGLGLLLYRVYGFKCDRTSGFSRGSLRCDVPREQEKTVLAVRNTEQALGILFLSAIALDIVIAQLTFEPFEVTGRRTLRRDELESDRTHRKTSALRVLPRPTLLPDGAGFSWRYRF